MMKAAPHISGENNILLVDGVEEKGFPMDSHLNNVPEWILGTIKT